jgi:hypothetical protein
MRAQNKARRLTVKLPPNASVSLEKEVKNVFKDVQGMLLLFDI